MEFLLKGVKVIHPPSRHHEATLDIHIKGGIVFKVGKNLSGPRPIQLNNGHISPGWVDLGTSIGEPGFEFRETFESCNRAARSGGFTTVVLLPNVHPARDSKSGVQYVLKNTSGMDVLFLPLGSLSQNLKGEDLSEMLEMKEAGAVGFTDGLQSVNSGNLMLRALQYAKTTGLRILNQPMFRHLVPEGQMHEGTTSTSLGVRGLPRISETLMLHRDLELLEYTKSRFHAFDISCEESIRMIDQARKSGLDVTASVPVMNLVHTDADLQSFDVHLKTIPPLRSDRDRDALLKAVKKGSIQVVSSCHRPLEPEAKMKEFPYAEFGSLGLETTFALLNSKTSLDLNHIVQSLSIGPREVLNLEIPDFEEGSPADFTLFDPDEDWVYSDIESIASNTPYLGESFKGRTLGIVRNENLWMLR